MRGVPPDEAQGARDWNEYTWRGDQAPGHPFVHGLQTSDMDFNDMRFSKLVIQIGKNLIENKMPESHWLNEVHGTRRQSWSILRRNTTVPATKADYWIGVRPGLSDTAVLAGRHEDPARREVVRAGLLPPLHRLSAVGPHRHAAPLAAAGRPGRLSAQRISREARRSRSRA